LAKDEDVKGDGMFFNTPTIRGLIKINIINGSNISITIGIDGRHVVILGTRRALVSQREEGPHLVGQGQGNSVAIRVALIWRF